MAARVPRMPGTSAAAADPSPAPVRLRPVRIAQPQPASAAALPSTRAMLGALFDATLDAVIIMDDQGHVSAWNPQAERIFGWTAAEVVGRRLGSLIVPKRLRARHEAGMRRFLASGVGRVLDQRLELPAVRRDGTEFPAELTITVVRSGSRLAFAGFLRDLTRERSAEIARSRAEDELAAARHERAEITAILQALRARATPEETAVDIAAAIGRIRSVEFVAIYSYEMDGRVVPLAVRSPAGVPISVSRPIPDERALYLRESSTGPWVDDWMPRASDDDYRRAWLEAGLTAAAYVPFGPRDEPYGLISAGVSSRHGRDTMTAILASVSEFAPVTGALLGPELVRRRAHADTREVVARTIETTAFHPVFQPIVELESRAVIGYEALTRFDDGTPPDRLFTEAERVGLGRELELATMDAALAAADALPADRWVSLNLSPDVILDAPMLAVMRQVGERQLVVELTERSAIEDYPAVRAALERFGEGVSLAVDDAGAGFASLRHIIELRPQFVKLDMRLVRGVDADTARQALIAGMVFFSAQVGCTLVAEGIETEDERRTLRRLGVNFGQGFLLGRPQRIGPV
jgi:PAS domain S-box-containing protein